MGINLTDLPPAAQRQALTKLMSQQKPHTGAPSCQPERASKFHNESDERAGIRFQSKKEARRFDELVLMERAGSIRGPKLQPQFTLQEAYTTPTGERVRAIRYQADFSYERPTAPDRFGVVHWLPVVEDVKSPATMTRVYSIKKKLMRDKLGIEIKEII